MRRMKRSARLITYKKQLFHIKKNSPNLRLKVKKPFINYNHKIKKAIYVFQLSNFK